ncbi:6550_t:CDS:2 [Funneliformis mosseae]|uniref:6550_t:CDS:1 n=1 Tax=Funneliformis mosseae TaxID=27381 RepID=A0A9N9BZ43_FUNMO|nr:6550_t:CDS:2 [Funneliformis mosseae]
MSQVKLYNNPLIIRNVEFKEYVTEKEALKKVDEFRFSDSGQTLSDSKKNSLKRIANYLSTHPNFDEVSDDHVLIREGYPMIFTSNNYRKLKYEKPVKKAEGTGESSIGHNQLLKGEITSAMSDPLKKINSSKPKSKIRDILIAKGIDYKSKTLIQDEDGKMKLVNKEEQEIFEVNESLNVEDDLFMEGGSTKNRLRGMDTINNNNGFGQNKSVLNDDNSSLKNKKFMLNQNDGIKKKSKKANKLIQSNIKSNKVVKKWQREIRTQQRSLDRQIRDFEEVEKKTTTLLKQNVKKKDLPACKLFAKELVRTRRQKTRLYTTTLKLSGSLKKSTEIMKMVNGLARLPELSKGMQELSMEMTKAGIIDEMLEDTFELMEDSDIEEEADEEVNKILFEVTNGLLGEASVVNVPLENPGLEEEEEPAAALDEMQARLHALKS